jgi:predicted transcriptional regulator
MSPDTMPRRITVTLADTVAEKLQIWADRRGQAIATVAAVAIELSVNQAEEKGELAPKDEKT